MFKAALTHNVLLEKQTKPLFKATLSGGLANILCAGLILVIVYGKTQASLAIILSSAITIFSILRIIVAHHYLTQKTFKLDHYLHTHIALTFLIGLTWAAYAYLQLNAVESLRSLVFLIIFGLIAASIATLSSWMLAYLAYMVPQCIAIFYVSLSLETEYNAQMATAFLMFTAIMIVTSLRFNRRFKKELELTYNNKQLISDLNNEIFIREKTQLQLEKNKSELEFKVEDRTKELQVINNNLEKVIEKKDEAERNLQHIAYHDELTGLPNKNLLVDRISQSIKKSTRDGHKMAILFLDLDRFKNINDSLGHTIGDNLLQEVASRLHKTLRSHDTVSRNGGDEFVIVLEKLKNSNEAIHVAKKIISQLTDTFVIHSHNIHIGASIGISVYPGDGNTPLVLLRNADTAMYRAKKSGGNQLHFYDESMSSQLRDRLEIENQLHSALHNNELYLVYQPQINCASGVTVGFESLLRWNNAKFGEISPDRFVPLLEETGLIYSVGEWIVNQVIDFISTQNSSATFSINLSPLQCNSLAFVEIVKNAINRTKINPKQIEFEITESLLIKDFEKTKRFLNELHNLGCTIALDDFGTGYTSMNYLARLPIDVIKIDKSLIRNIDSNNNLKSIVNAIVTMSQSLGMTNIFEGIESEAELNVIKGMNGEVIQGFWYSKPLLAQDVNGWLGMKVVAHQA